MKVSSRTAPLASGTIVDALTSALLALGTEDITKPETIDAARTARVLIETMPAATLAELLLALWKIERPEYERVCRRDPHVASLFLLLFLIDLPIMLLIEAHLLPVWLSLFAVPCVGILFFYLFRKNASAQREQLQKGIHRLALLRPQTEFVPLLVNTLASAGAGASIAKRSETRFLLTHYLPLWCERDSDDLTLYQQEVLLADIRLVLQGSNLLMRPLGKRTEALSIDEADYVLAALAALRRCRSSSKQGRRAQQVFFHLHAPVAADDPRYGTNNAVQMLRVQQGD